MTTPTPQEAREAYHRIVRTLDMYCADLDHDDDKTTIDAYITASEAGRDRSEKHRNELADKIVNQSIEIGALKAQLAARDALLAEAGEVLEAIRSGDAREPLASKNDKCSHGKYGWEDCENCISEYAASVLQKIREVK